ncbi:MAG: hypothetical protein ACI36X_03225, partial [Bacteroidaceae bacterium]
ICSKIEVVIIITLMTDLGSSIPTLCRTKKRKAVCHNGQSAALLSAFGLGRVRQYTPFDLSLSALHLDHSDAPLRLCQNWKF